MRLSINIVGKTIEDIELTLKRFMKEVKNKQLESNCCCSYNDGYIDYIFTNGTDIFEKDDEIVIHPYN